MPSRILKESICTSETIESLTNEQEVFFYRLIVQCDDYGELDARPAILRARLYPLRITKVTEELILKWLTALCEAGLIQVYTVNGHPYLHIKTWASHQQMRAQRHKYIAIDNPDSQLVSPENICNQLKSNDNRFPRNPNPIQSESNPNPKREHAKATSTQIKNTYGEFNNVFLTDKEYENLGERFTSTREGRIAKLSEYKKSKGVSYKDDYATILTWARKDEEKKNIAGKEKGGNGRLPPGNNEDEPIKGLRLVE